MPAKDRQRFGQGNSKSSRVVTWVRHRHRCYRIIAREMLDTQNFVVHSNTPQVAISSAKSSIPAEKSLATTSDDCASLGQYKSDTHDNRREQIPATKIYVIASAQHWVRILKLIPTMPTCDFLVRH